MAEVFSRSSIAPAQYNPNTWSVLHEVKSTVVGALVFDLSAINCAEQNSLPAGSITVECKHVDADNNLVNWVFGPQELAASGDSVVLSRKLVMSPGDRLLVRANRVGISFYCSLIGSLKAM